MFNLNDARWLQLTRVDRTCSNATTAAVLDPGGSVMDKMTVVIGLMNETAKDGPKVRKKFEFRTISIDFTSQWPLKIEAYKQRM